MDDSWLLLLSGGLLVFVGAVVQSSLGFGLALVAAPLLYLIDPLFVPGPLLAVIVCLSGITAWHERHAVDLRELGSAFLGRIPGMVIALGVLTYPMGQVLPLLISLAVLATVAVSLLSVAIRPTPRRLMLAGFASGFMGTATAVGGPAMALVYQNEAGPKVRGNLSAYFFIGCVVSLLGLVAIRRFGIEQLVLTLWLAPMATLGFVVGRLIIRWLDRSLVRPGILVISTISALAVLAEALL